MPDVFSDITVDLNIFPSILQFEPYLALGDMHGNTMKLLYSLIRHGMASGISEEEYYLLLKIYLNEPDINAIDKFNTLINKLIINPEIQKLVLIGDLLADRGNNDYFTLKLLHKIKQGLPRAEQLEIILSNHDLELLMARERIAQASKIDFISPYLKSLQCYDDSPYKIYLASRNSLIRLQSFIDKDLKMNPQSVFGADVLKLIDEVYPPCIKLLCYQLNEGQPPEINIFSHAPIGVNNLRQLAEYLEVRYDDNSAEALAYTIDRINAQFQARYQDIYIELATLEIDLQQANAAIKTSTESDSIKSEQEKNVSELIKKQTNHPVYFIVWNRDYSLIDRPSEYKGYRINYIHGHDSNPNVPQERHYLTLDTPLGMKILDKHTLSPIYYSKASLLSQNIRRYSGYRVLTNFTSKGLNFLDEGILEISEYEVNSIMPFGRFFQAVGNTVKNLRSTELWDSLTGLVGSSYALIGHGLGTNANIHNLPFGLSQTEDKHVLQGATKDSANDDEKAKRAKNELHNTATAPAANPSISAIKINLSSHL